MKIKTKKYKVYYDYGLGKHYDTVEAGSKAEAIEEARKLCEEAAWNNFDYGVVE